MSYKFTTEQSAMIDLITNKRRFGLFAPVGSGKTAVALGVREKLKAMLPQTVIIAPPYVGRFVWQQEHLKWDDLEAFESATMVGESPARRVKLRSQGFPVIITTPSLCHEETYDKNTLVIIDEAHHFRHRTSKRFKLAYKVIAPHAGGIILLTGTPTGQDYMGLFALIKLLDGGKRLGRNWQTFADNYCKSYRVTAVISRYKFRSDKEAELRIKIRDTCGSLPILGGVGKAQEIEKYVSLGSPKLEKAYQVLERDSIFKFGDWGIPPAMNTDVKFGQCLQVASGALYYSKDEYKVLSTSKIKALEDILVAEKRALIVYNFIHEKERIGQLLTNLGYTYAVYSDDRAIENWLNRKISYLLCHPKGVGEGLNLQAKDADLLIWFSPGTSALSREQMNGRLLRPGGADKVRLIYLLTEGTIEKGVHNALKAKIEGNRKLIEWLKLEVK